MVGSLGYGWWVWVVGCPQVVLVGCGAWGVVGVC